MWVLINEGKPAIRYSLIEGQTYNIGRVPSNEISIGNDVSISRVHGTINVEKNISDRGKLDSYQIIKLFVEYFCTSLSINQNNSIILKIKGTLKSH